MPGLGDETARREAKARWIADLEEKPEFQLLRTIDNDQYSTPENIVRQIIARTSSLANDSSALGGHLYDTACSILEIVSRTPAIQQAGVIAFIVQLRESDIKDPETGEALKYDDQLVWQELPTFGYTFADELNSFNPLHPNIEPEQEQRWENLTAFFAQVTASSDHKDLDFSPWALTALAYAFGPHGPQVPATAISLRASCLWFIYAARNLWNKVLDEDATSWNRDEWVLWKQAFIDSKNTNLDNRTNEAIVQAVTEMEKVEKN